MNTLPSFTQIQWLLTFCNIPLRMRVLPKGVCVGSGKGYVWGPASAPRSQQKPINSPGWWEGEFALFQMPAAEKGGQTAVQRRTPPPPSTAISGAGAFIDSRRGLHVEAAQSALTVIFRLVTDGRPSVILVVLSAVTR